MWKQRALKTEADLEIGFSVLRQLRTDLDWAEFLFRYRAAAAGGYEFVGWFEEDRCVAVLGYRALVDFVHGPHLYLDDLVVVESLRSSGLGSRILGWAEEEAARRKLSRLRLCTGVENERGKRFYEKNGWTARAVAFKKSLEP
jgi:GNAT superfamily N-acetyltransferase